METLQYKLQKFDPGVVLLSADNRILAMNQIAQRVLSNIRGNPIGRDVLQLHPEKSKEKIQLLLHSGWSCSTSRPIGLPLMLLSTLCAIWFIARMRLSALSKTTPGSNFCSLYWSVSMVYADKASGCARQQESLLSLAGYFPPVRALILRS